MFVRFKFSDQLRSNVDSINNFGVINVADPDVWFFCRLNIDIFVGLYTLSFYVINMDDGCLFVDSSFLFLTNLYLIVQYQMNKCSLFFVNRKEIGVGA